MFSLENKTAVVTGAARGMGRATAKLLAAQGAKVAVTDVLTDEIATLADEIKAAGGHGRAWALDVSKAGAVNQVFDEIVADFGRLDILVNNAGIFKPRPVLEITEAEWNLMIDINLKGQFLCAQRAGQEMKEINWGRIVNIASVASGQVGVGIAGGTHYTASKGGVLGLTESLAIELAPWGVNVNAISPGVIDTPMVTEAGFSEEAMQALLQKVPLGRQGRPEEIAYAVLFLVSEESGYITGANLAVDGGWLAS